jgi:riboflavin synthase
VLSDLGRGDSISCSGTCLTAIEIDDEGFTADVMLETLKRSSLSEVKVGDPINLERAMSATTRFGGHVVQGHVDGVGEFVSREKERQLGLGAHQGASRSHEVRGDEGLNHL